MMKKYIKISFFLALSMLYSSILFGQNSKKSNTIIQFNKSELFSSENAEDAITNLSKPQGENFSFKKKSEQIDDLGFKTEDFETYYNGIPVAYSLVRVLSKNGIVDKIIRNIPDMKVYKDSKNFLSNKDALQAAKKALPADEYVWENETQSKLLNYKKPYGELVILPIIHGITSVPRTAYVFDIFTSKPANREKVFVDAISGEHIFSETLIHHQDVPASGQSVYNGNVQFTANEYIPGNYELRNTSLGAEIETRDAQGSLAVNGVPVASNATTFNNERAVQAHYGIEAVYNYFKTSHGRNSFDGNGSKINVHVNTRDFNLINNAFWFQNQIYFTVTSPNKNPLSQVEIAGHEFSHGVVNYTADLIYRDESGALNESFADIFGFMSKFKKIGTTDWELGRGINPLQPTVGFRNMANPGAFNDPKFYQGYDWTTDPFNEDYGGVHTNSGVQNHWFYLVSQGGSGTNEVGNTFAITGVGLEKAAAIAYRNLTVYLTPSSQYLDSRNGSIEAARDLYGIGSPEEIAVTNAWHAVGIGAPYGQTTITCGPADVIFEIDVDGNPQDIMLYVVNDTGFTEVGAGPGSFENQAPGSTYTSQVYTFPNQGSYKIHIYDLDGDGLTTGAHTGEFRMKDTNGNVLMTLNNFDFSKGAEYCVGYAGTRVYEFVPPVGPSYFNLTSVTDTTADFEWGTYTDNVGVVANYLYYDKNLQVYYTGNTGGLTGLLPCTEYTVVAFATDPDNNISSPGGKITFTTTGASCDIVAPSIPINLAASNIGETTLYLSWDTSTDNVAVAGYKVFKDGVEVANVASNSTSISNLTAATSYNFEVLAYDAAGNESARSNVYSAMTIASNSCAQSLQLKMTFGSNPEFLQWLLKDSSYNIVKASANGQYYNETPGSILTEAIDVSTLPDGDYNFVFIDFGSNGTMFELKDGSTSLVSGSNVSYSQVDQICIRNSAGNNLDLTPPTTITDLSVVGSTSNSVDLSWTPASDNAGVFSQLVLVNGIVRSNIWQSNANTYTVSNLSPGTSYTIELLTWDIGGNFSAVSNTVNVMTQNAIMSTLLNQGFFETGWDGWSDGGSDCKRMSHSRSLEGNKSIRLRDNSGTASSMISSNYDMSGYDYVNLEFLVNVFSFENNEDFYIELNTGSGWNTVDRFAKPQDIYNDGNFKVNSIIRNTDFNFSSGSKLRIRCDASGNWDQIYVDEVLIEGVTGGTTPTSSYSTINVITPSRPIISNDGPLEEYDEIVMYPNPAINSFTLKGIVAEDLISISIYDIKGRLVKTFNKKSISYDVSELTSGIYIVKCIMEDGEFFNQKLVKQ